MATKENILEIAKNLMLQKGFSWTSLDEIISAAWSPHSPQPTSS